MIRYLEKDEYGTCIPLWKEAFPDDSEEFLEYYFGKKIMGSRVLVKEDEDGKMLTMAHLNPYHVMVGVREYDLPYIVGVATAADSRHQGHMRDLLLKMLKDMHDSGLPFCYLMPASPEIYRPFGFVYIFDQPVWKEELAVDSGNEALEKINLRLDRDNGENAAEGQKSVIGPEYLACWINHWLQKRYEVYAKRCPDYLDMLQAELDSEDGCVTGYLDKQGQMAALQAFWGMEKREQRFLYCKEDAWLRAADPDMPEKPAIMARITDVATMAESISVNEDCPCTGMEVLVRIKDRLIGGNNGLWRWNLDAEGSRLQRVLTYGDGKGTSSDGAMSSAGALPSADLLTSTEVLEITVEQLTTWLFGYRPLDEILEEEGEDPPFWWQYIKPLQGVFLDEIV